MIELPRRQFLRVLTGIIAAPAVVKAESLMKVVAVPKNDLILLRFSLPDGPWRSFIKVVDRDVIEAMIRPPVLVKREQILGTWVEVYEPINLTHDEIRSTL